MRATAGAVFILSLIAGHAFTPVDMNAFAGENCGPFIAQRKEASQKGLITTPLALIEELEREFQAAPPTRTFEEEDSIRLGDLTLILYHTGRDGAPVSLYNHTRSDIFVYGPEERVLCVGDSFYMKEWLDRPPDDPPPDLLNGFLVRSRERNYVIEHVVFGHDPFLSKGRDTSSPTEGFPVRRIGAIGEGTDQGRPGTESGQRRSST